MNELGVLLPVRLETRVDQPYTLPDGTRSAEWRLRLRIIPDEVSALRHRPEIQASEWELLSSFWKEYSGADVLPASLASWLNTAAGVAAWRRLALAVTPPRAAWLVDWHRPERLDAAGRGVLPVAPQLDQQPTPNRVGGFPEVLTVWALFGGPHPVQLATISVKHDQLILDPPVVENVPDPNQPGATQKRLKRAWWNTWHSEVDPEVSATGVGLGVECKLLGTPQTLKALFVVGLGDEEPFEHFANRVSTGDMAILECGLPTNTVQGEPAISLDLDPENWRAIAIARLTNQSTAVRKQVSSALTGSANALLSMPGEQRGDNPANPSDPGYELWDHDAALAQSLVRTLWTPLWGHALRDIWGLREEAELFATRWAAKYLFAEGPLPAVRFGDQPYGLLPATSIRRAVTSIDPDIKMEVQLANLLAELLRAWFDVAQKQGNVVNGTAAQLLRFTAEDGLSRSFGTRQSWNVSHYLGKTPFDIRNLFERDSEPSFQRINAAVGIEPAHVLLSRYNVFKKLPIPLVAEKKSRETAGNFAELLEKTRESYQDNYTDFAVSLFGQVNERPNPPPKSLLMRLIIWAWWYTRAAWSLESDPTLIPPGSSSISFGSPLTDDWFLNQLLMEPAVVDERAVTIEGAAQPFTQEETEFERLVKLLPSPSTDQAAGKVHQLLRAELKRLANYFELIHAAPNEQARQQQFQRLERIFSATLDSAMHRIDPWITGLAWSRYNKVLASGVTPRLGVYGWVDGPMILEQPGPSPENLLHTPSHQQTTTAVVLRDKFLFEQQERAERNPWEMNLDSRSVRLVSEMADEIRLGVHLWEAIGRRVEDIVRDRNSVAFLRASFKIRSERQDVQNVCHGLDALAAFKAGSIAGITLTQQQEQQLMELGGGFMIVDQTLGALKRRGVPDATVTKLQSLVDVPFISRAAFDTQLNGTLTPGELTSFRNLIANQAEVPSLVDVYGDLLMSEAVHQMTQGRADAAGASMDAAIGLQHPPTLDFVKTPRQGRSVRSTLLCALPWKEPVTGTLSPGEVADPSVAAALKELTGPAESWIWRDPSGAAQLTLADLGLQPIDALALGPELVADIFRARFPAATTIAGSGPHKHRQARAFVQAIGRYPCLWRDVVTHRDASATVPYVDSLDAAIRSELIARLRRLQDLAKAMCQQLETAATNIERQQLLRRAITWGIAPQDPEISPLRALDMVFWEVAVDSDTPRFKSLCSSAAAALKARLKVVDGAEFIDANAGWHGLTNAQQIAAAIAELASPTGTLAVMSKINRDQLVLQTGLNAALSANLEMEWLSVVAAVRPSAARLEAWQLEREVAEEVFLQSRSNSADPWLTDEIDANEKREKSQDTKIRERTVPHFVAAYGTAATWPATDWAIALVDAWNETVPAVRHSTSAAFHFNSPAARPPQAILLAVPPDPTQTLDATMLRDIVMETRELAQARTVNIDQLKEWKALVPLSALPSTGTTGFKTDK